MPDRFDLIVIGAGQGGDPLARAFAKAGKRAAIIEREHVGGSCVNYGCTPTKLLAATAKAARQAARAADLGVRATFEGVDWAKIRARKDDLVGSFRDGTEDGLEKKGVEIVRGEAKFVGERRIAVGDREIEGEIVVIDVGTRAAVPKIEGLDNVPFLDNKSLLDLEELPKKLLILGGGYIAVEFAQTFRRFGSEVTILEKGKDLLSIEDEDVSVCIREALEDEGVEVLCGTEIERAESGPALLLKDGRRVEGSHLLIATGRTPNTDSLDAAKGGVELDEKGFVKVDAALKTTAEGTYVIGDAKGGPAFTHISYDDYRILASNLLGGGHSTTEGRQAPWCVYTDPQVGHVGLNEKALKEAGIPYRTCKLDAEGMARANESDENRGFLKVMLAADSDEILGCTAVLPEGGEIATIAQIAMIGGLPARKLCDAILIHPSWAEAYNSVFDSGR